MRVAIVLYEGFDELDAVGPYEVLRNARTGGADVATLLVTREPAATVTGSHGMTIGLSRSAAVPIPRAPIQTGAE